MRKVIAVAVLYLYIACFSRVVAQELKPGREHIPGAESLTGSLQLAAGYPLKVYVTRPLNASGRVPVLFVAAWLSCDSTEAPQGPTDGFTQLLFDLAGRSGLATYRADKPGVGGSGGPKCSELDFTTELAAYQAAFAAMLKLPFIDPTRVYLVGFSNGGGFAPLVAGHTPVCGYMVFSGWYKTWLEHMLEHERRRMRLSGLSETAINTRMKQYATFYDLYLNHGNTPGEIVSAHPELKDIWYDEPDHQYGRPAVFYQQLQALNLAQAWSAVNVPVLAIHGEYDWIMSESDYRLLVDAINARRAGTAEFVNWPHADHGLYSHASAQLAFRTDPQQTYDPKLSDYVLNWLAKNK